MVVLGGGAVFYERGTPVAFMGLMVWSAGFRATRSFSFSSFPPVSGCSWGLGCRVGGLQGSRFRVSVSVEGVPFGGFRVRVRDRVRVRVRVSVRVRVRVGVGVLKIRI